MRAMFGVMTGGHVGIGGLPGLLWAAHLLDEDMEAIFR